VAPVRGDQQGITAAQIARLGLIVELQAGAALQHRHPFMFG